MRHANYRVVIEDAKRLVIQDVGPWDVYPTVTNDAEWVVESLAGKLAGRRLFYIDSENEMDELVVKDGQFGGFLFGGTA